MAVASDAPSDGTLNREINRHRFESFFHKSGPDDCWPWRGSVKNVGTADWTIAGKDVSARRVAWELYVGHIPDLMRVFDSCGNKSCMNPKHLYVAEHRAKESGPTDSPEELGDDRYEKRIKVGLLQHADFIADALSRYRGVDWDETRTERLTVKLHWPWPSGLEIPWDDGNRMPPDTLSRPAIFRSVVISTPIDRTARRVSCDRSSTPCPYCNSWFRNPGALALHVRDSHEMDARYVWSDTRLGIRHEEKVEVQRVEAMKSVEQREQQELAEWLRWL